MQTLLSYKKVRNDIDRIHEVTDNFLIILASIAICLTAVNIIVLIVLYCYHCQRHTRNLDLVHDVKPTVPQQIRHHDPDNEVLHIIENCPDCGMPPHQDDSDNDNDN